MSVVRPLRCLFSRATAVKTSPAAGIRTFNSTAIPQFPRDRPTPNDLINPSSKKSELTRGAAHYSKAQIEELRKFYSPAQVKALLAGEQSINPEDFENRVERMHNDPFAMKYLDDLSSYDPLLDFPMGKTPYVTGHPEQPLPKIDDPNLKFPEADEASEFRIRDLARITGFSPTQLKNVRTRVMVTHSVTNQTRMGKIRKIYALVVAGNQDGLLGIGEGKSAEGEDAIRQANYMAIRNMEPIPRFEGRTIHGDVEVKFGAVELKLMARPPGFGVRCSNYIFEMCRCLGIHDLSARVTRSRNPMNTIKATMMALKGQKLPETIARGRGRKLVDVRKVYYSGHM
ncbi:28S ribosomal protein S5, mitochondrial [Rhizina undulata]